MAPRCGFRFAEHLAQPLPGSTPLSESRDARLFSSISYKTHKSMDLTNRFVEFAHPTCPLCTRRAEEDHLGRDLGLPTLDQLGSEERVVVGGIGTRSACSCLVVAITRSYGEGVLSPT